MYGTANIAGAMWPEYLYTGRLAAYSGLFIGIMTIFI